MISASGLGIACEERATSAPTSGANNTPENYPTINTNTSQSLKNLPPPPPGFDNSTVVPIEPAPPESTETLKKDSPTNDTPKSSPKKQDPTANQPGLVTNFKQRWTNLSSRIKNIASSSPPRKTKPSKRVNGEKQASKSASSCVIPLGEVGSESKHQKTGQSSDSEDYYPTLTKTDKQNNSDEAKKTLSSSDIYANLSLRSKSNASMSSKLTEATAAVIAANRGSIKSSIKKNKKAAAAAMSAKSGSTTSRGRESDYYQIVSTSSGIKPSNGTASKKVN